MTGTQERAVAAMRAIGDTVTGAPPLRLPRVEPPRPSRRRPVPSPRPARSARLAGPGRARLAAVAGPRRRGQSPWSRSRSRSSVVRSAPKEVSAGSAGHRHVRSVPSAAQRARDGVPRYFVALPAFGWYAYAPADVTGQAAAARRGSPSARRRPARRLATVAPPHGVTFNVVTGAADDRAFRRRRRPATSPGRRP